MGHCLLGCFEIIADLWQPTDSLTLPLLLYWYEKYKIKKKHNTSFHQNKNGKMFLPPSYPVFPPSSKLAKFAMIKTPGCFNQTWISFLTKLDIRILIMNSFFVSDWVSLKFCGSKYFNLLKSYCMFKLWAKFSWVL